LHLPDDDEELLSDDTLAARTAALQGQVADALALPCTACGGALCEHGALLAVVFGCRRAPRCPECLAAEANEPLTELLERALQWIRRRDCFLYVWRRAGENERDGGATRRSAACTFAATGEAGAAVAAPTAAPPAADASFDAGDLGCGDLVLELRGRVRALPPRGVLRVTARDPAAPIDLPAWCGLCGHTLLHASHPDYWIRKKGD